MRNEWGGDNDILEVHGVMERSLLPIFCILCKQVTIPSSHVMARKYSHVMVCHMSDCVVLVDQAHDKSRG